MVVACHLSGGQVGIFVYFDPWSGVRNCVLSPQGRNFAVIFQTSQNVHRLHGMYYAQ